MNRSARILSLATACILTAGSELAQGRPTVFLHGFGAEASDWATIAERLRATVAIEPYIPSLAWRTDFESQARDLQAQPQLLMLADDTVAVGHSNGGLVAREWSRSRSLDGIVTIGTPHGGAPILQNLARWLAFNEATPFLLNRAVDAFSNWSDWTWVFPFVDEALRWTSDFSLWSAIHLVTTLGAHEALPVGYQMLPGSGYLEALNAGSNLNREAAQIPNRLGIVSVAHNFFYAGPARAIAPDQADAIATAMYGAAFGLLFWGNYLIVNAPPTDFRAMDQAFALIDVANHILAIDPTYCRMVSTIDMSECAPNDGIVPADSQLYPNAPNLVIGTENDGPAHTQEKEQSDDVLYAALVSYMLVPPRRAQPPVLLPPDPSPDPPNAPEPDSSPDPESDDDSAVLLPRQLLYPGDVLHSLNGRVHLAYQRDGNLVLYDDGWVPLWASHTSGTRAGFVAMQADGNLVIYDPDGAPLWSSATFGYPGASLVVQNDGNGVIYDVDGIPLWSTGTSVL